MAADVHGITVAILLSDGYETAELDRLRSALDDAGAITRLLGERPGGLQARRDGKCVAADLALDEVDANEFDVLLVPGGEAAAPRLRSNPFARALALSFFSEGKPVAAVADGVGLLLSADVVRGKRLTGPSALRTEARAAGAEWVEEEMVVDGALATARAATPSFIEQLIVMLGEQVSWTPAREGTLRRQHPASEV